ncbi:6-phosphogluconolactonase [soil metagenome]
MDPVAAPLLRVSDDPTADCAAAIARHLGDALGARGRATLAVSGGSTAPPLFAALARRDVDWSRVEVWQVDERVAPDGDADRNATQLSALPAASHLMPVTAPDLPAAATDYASSLPDRFDVVHLGMGPDGHTASWPPGDPVIDDSAPVGVSQPYQGRVRMTLTPGVVNAAVHRCVLLLGADKAEALADWVAGDGDVPIARVAPPDTVVFTDTAAAALAIGSEPA